MSKQTKAIELLAMGEMTHAEIASEVGVNANTITKWKKKPEFMEAVLERSRVLFKQTVPDVYKALKREAASGSDRHIKIFLDHLEKLEEARAGQLKIEFKWKEPATDD